MARITSYNVCYTKLLRSITAACRPPCCSLQRLSLRQHITSLPKVCSVPIFFTAFVITSYSIHYTKLYEVYKQGPGRFGRTRKHRHHAGGKTDSLLCHSGRDRTAETATAPFPIPLVSGGRVMLITVTLPSKESKVPAHIGFARTSFLI